MNILRLKITLTVAWFNYQEWINIVVKAVNDILENTECSVPNGYDRKL